MLIAEASSGRLNSSEEARVTEATRWTEKAVKRITKSSSVAKHQNERNIADTVYFDQSFEREPPPLTEATRQRLLAEARAEKARLLADIQKLLSEELGSGDQVIEATNLSVDDQKLMKNLDILHVEKIHEAAGETMLDTKSEKSRTMDEGERNAISNKKDWASDTGSKAKKDDKTEAIVKETYNEFEKQKPTVETTGNTIECETSSANEVHNKQKEAEGKFEVVLGNEEDDELRLESRRTGVKEENNVVQTDALGRREVIQYENTRPKILYKGKKCVDNVAGVEDITKKDEINSITLPRSVSSLEEVQMKRWEGLRAAGRMATTRYLATGWKLSGQHCKGEHCDRAVLVEKAGKVECLVCGGSGSGKDGVYTGVYSGVHNGLLQELNEAKETKVGKAQDNKKLNFEFKCGDGPDIFSCGMYYTYDDMNITGKKVPENVDEAIATFEDGIREKEEENMSQATVGDEKAPWDEKTIPSEVAIMTSKKIDTSKKSTQNIKIEPNNVVQTARSPEKITRISEERVGDEEYDVVNNKELNIMYQREVASQEMGRMLANGWTILNECCSICEMPLLGQETGQVACALCGSLETRDDETIESVGAFHDRIEAPKTKKKDPPAIVANDRVSTQATEKREETIEGPTLPIDLSDSQGKNRLIPSLGTPEDIANERLPERLVQQYESRAAYRHGESFGGNGGVSSRVAALSGTPEDLARSRGPTSVQLKTRMKPPRPEANGIRRASCDKEDHRACLVDSHEYLDTPRFSEKTSSPVDSITISPTPAGGDVAAQAFDVILERMEKCKSRILSNPSEVPIQEIALIERLAAAASAVQRFAEAE